MKSRPSTLESSDPAQARGGPHNEALTGGAIGAVERAQSAFASNAFVGWTSMAVGVGTGLILGLWSFNGPLPVPAWIGEYGDTSRRLVRLGHIAFIGLGILNVLMSRELPRSGLSQPLRRAASLLMNFGNIFLPIALFATGALLSLKPLMAPPAIAVFLALVLIAWGARGRGALA